MLEIPYKQIKTNSEKAVFYLGFLWQSLVDTGIINPRKVELFGGKESVIYGDYDNLLKEMKSTLEKRHIDIYDEIIQYIDKNLIGNEEYSIKHSTFYVLGSLYASSLKGNMITASEANEKWGLPDGEVRQSINRGKLKKYIGTGFVRQSGKVWLVSEQAMKEVYGEQKEENE